MQELNVGYDNGSDRLIMRYPQLVTHTITQDSPLSPWANTTGMPSYAAEIVVVVEGVMFYNSSSMMRTITYQLPDNLKLGQSFVPMVSRGDTGSAVPVVNWQAFHATVPTGSSWVPGESTPSRAGGRTSVPDPSGVSAAPTGGSVETTAQ